LNLLVTAAASRAGQIRRRGALHQDAQKLAPNNAELKKKIDFCKEMAESIKDPQAGRFPGRSTASMRPSSFIQTMPMPRFCSRRGRRRSSDAQSAVPLPRMNGYDENTKYKLLSFCFVCFSCVSSVILSF
jgi:hypothetical protein